MNIEDEHWTYTEKVIAIGMIISSIADLHINDTEEDAWKFEKIMKCLEELYKEAFKHGAKHERGE